MKSILVLTLATLVLVPIHVTAADPSPSRPQAPMPLAPDGWKSSWSPDGQELVMGIGDGEGLEILDLRTLQRRRILERGKDPVWSPKGPWIALVREEVHNELVHEETWVVRSDGREARRLGLGGYPTWSGDGTKVYALRRDNWRLVALDRETGKATELGEFRNSYYPAVSPDGRLIAFGSERSLVVMERESGKRLHTVPAEADRGLLPSWSPDGKYVGYGGFDADSSGIRVLEVATGRHAMVWPGPFTSPAWTSDGKRMAFDLRSFGDRAIWQVGQGWVEGRLSGELPLPENEFTVEEPDEPEEPEQPEDTRSLVGKAAPSFELKDMTGRIVDAKALKGRVVVLDFWATWCPPCRRALPHLDEVAKNKELREKGLDVYAVDVREERDEVAAFLKKEGFGFNVLLDGEGEVSERYLVQGIPTTVVIDREGTVRDVFVGYGPESGKQLDEAIARVLK